MTERYFIESDDVPTNVLPWGKVKWMTGPDVNGADGFSAGVTELDPGKGHDLHTHPESEEILFVLRGEGEQSVDGDRREVTAGDMIYIPADIEHGTWNTGWEAMQILAVYAPAGPEATVAADPECTVVPPGEAPVREE
jgi:quercetin dioxygenase-like cupin family protein